MKRMSQRLEKSDKKPRNKNGKWKKEYNEPAKRIYLSESIANLGRKEIEKRVHAYNGDDNNET